MIIRSHAYPRVGLVGNPSDGYFGKTISFTFDAFSAEVTLYQSPELVIEPASRDHSVFASVEALVADVRAYGYYGGIRLLKASVKRFRDYCRENGIELDDRNYTLRYRSTIPHQVGLAGSSAIITACFRVLMAFYQVEIPPPVLAGCVLSVETEELGISAGLQDRVAQVYEGLTYMDFDRQLLESQGYGRYEALDPALLPPLYLAYRTDLAEGSEVFHNNFRERFRRGDPEVVEAVRFWVELTDRVRDRLAAGEGHRIGELLDANFDRRAALYHLSEGNLRLVETARSCGASAKFSGSGGAIVGAVEDETMFRRLRECFAAEEVEVIRPRVIGGRARQA
jgi:glucuronokinase